MKKVDIYKDELNFLEGLCWFKMNHKVRERIDRRIAYIEVNLSEFTILATNEGDGSK